MAIAKSALIASFVFFGWTGISDGVGSGVAQAQAYGCTPLPAQDPAFSAALDALENGEHGRALILADSAASPLLGDVIRWQSYSQDSSPVTFQAISELIDRRSNWPRLGTLRVRGEKILPLDLSAEESAHWFDQAEPQTFDGLMTYLDALRTLRRHDDLVSVARDYWRRYPMRSDQQRAFVSRVGDILTTEDHWKRADRFVWNNDLDQALAATVFLNPEQEALIRARVSLRRRAPGVDAAIKRVPPNLQENEGLLYDRLTWRRREGLVDGALDMLSQQPEDAEYSRSWWRSRMVMARDALDEGRPGEAYALAVSHRQKAGVRLVESEWLAGWISLHRLQRPGQAAEHFAAILHASSTPISRSRGAYWLGEAWNAMGDREKANRWWDLASKYPMAFYGQLAGQRLGRLEPFGTADVVPTAPIASGHFGEIGCLTLALARLGASELVDPFINHIARRAAGQDDQRALAGLSLAVGRLPVAVGAGKKLMAEGYWLPNAAYPRIPLPGSLGAAEQAITLAIVRQESVFDQRAVSRAGARGLMQLMPGTASDVSKRISLAFTQADLTARPEINLRLGTVYFEELLGRYNGSIVLAIAAYNAGPGNVNRWIRRYGDPRDRSVDVRHWIESIPYSETRNYVQRVLENIIVYRRLDGQNGSEVGLSSLLSVN